MGVDGRAAAQTLLGYRNIRPGLCLYYVWQAYKAHGATASGTWPTAYAAWIDTPGKHEGDRNPPAGVPVWFGPKASSNAGDVVISLGGGRVACTDWPVYGQVGSCTIDERQRQIGRPYLGWTETILGARIDFASAAPASLSGGQRTAKTIVNRRAEPTSKSAIAGDPLQPGAVGNFTGWIRGESVEGNNVWYRGVSGHWFWSGGFHEGANGTGLTDLNPKAPAAGNERTVGASSQANGRSGPSRSNPVVQTLEPGTVGTFNGWTKGESVEGIDTWFRGALAGNWFWAGGFTSQSTAGLEQIGAATPSTPSTPTTPTTPTVPTSVDNPRGLPVVQPHYPGAYLGLEAPLGDGPRGFKGPATPGFPNGTPVPYVIDQFHIHRTGNDGDETDWFSYKNSRSSCPHLLIMKDARAKQFIRPKMKPCLTGPEWNWRGYGVEIQGAGDGTEAQFETVADAMAWLASYEGKELDGVPVTYNLRQRANTTLNHREMLPGTECPGDWWANHMDALVNRARTILATKYAPPADVEPPIEPALLGQIHEAWQKLGDLLSELGKA